ncbi:MAG: chalcone isomerase family protein, partial [Bdellovibrionota bacterium]
MSSASVDDMKTLGSFIFAVLLLLTASASYANPNFAQEVKVDDKKLSLLGVGTRLATMFKVKVYDAALYVEDKAKVDPADASVKVVRMEFLRDVSGSDIKKVWEDAFPKSCAEPCTIDFKEFLENVQDAKKGDFHQYTIWPERVKVEQGTKSNEYKQKGLGLTLL